MGLISIVFLVVLSLYFAIKDKRNTPDFVYCAWGFIIFGIINLCATSAARIYISPWYCAYSVFVWTGICALAVGVLCQATKKPPSIPARGFASIVLLYCLVFYVITNRNYADKDFFRPFHSPMRSRVFAIIAGRQLMRFTSFSGRNFEIWWHFCGSATRLH